MAHLGKVRAATKAPTDEWPTPVLFFKHLHEEFNFTLDAAATRENAKCLQYYTQEDNGLAQPWTGRVFCNPPYRRGVIIEWLQKAVTACSEEGADLVVMLLPTSLDTNWFHKWVAPYAHEVRVYRGRLCFGDGKGKAPFGSMVIVFQKGLRPQGDIALRAFELPR